MEALLIILAPGLAGGCLLALLIAGARPNRGPVIVPRRLAAPTPELINMSHIHVEGVGGLGMVAAVVAVAAADPLIRLAMIAAAILGVGLALLLIGTRRRAGAWPSAGDGPGAPISLHLDGRSRPQATPPATMIAGSRWQLAGNG